MNPTGCLLFLSIRNKASHDSIKRRGGITAILRSVCAVALFVLFARATRTRLVAPDLLFLALRGLGCLGLVAFDLCLIIAADVASTLFIFRPRRCGGLMLEHDPARLELKLWQLLLCLLLGSLDRGLLIKTDQE